MTIEKAIKLAIEVGWGEDDDEIQWALLPNVNRHQILLDPKFWQSLGKALGWKNVKECPICMSVDCFSGVHKEDDLEGWYYHWHSFIDHLADGGTIESYFEKL